MATRHLTFLITNGSEMIDKRIQVRYSAKFGCEKGKIITFDMKKRRHLVQYDDGVEEELDLLKPSKNWRLII